VSVNVWFRAERSATVSDGRRPRSAASNRHRLIRARSFEFPPTAWTLGDREATIRSIGRFPLQEAGLRLLRGGGSDVRHLPLKGENEGRGTVETRAGIEWSCRTTWSRRPSPRMTQRVALFA
jgi:hypothetical protein